MTQNYQKPRKLLVHAPHMEDLGLQKVPKNIVFIIQPKLKQFYASFFVKSTIQNLLMVWFDINKTKVLLKTASQI